MSELAKLRAKLEGLKNLHEIVEFAKKYDPHFVLNLFGAEDPMALTNCSGTADLLIEIYLSNDFFTGNAEKIYQSEGDGRSVNIVQSNSDNADRLRKKENLIVRSGKRIEFSPNCSSEILKLSALGSTTHWLTVLKNGNEIAVLHGWDREFSLFPQINDSGYKTNYFFDGNGAEDLLDKCLTNNISLVASTLECLKKKPRAEEVVKRVPNKSMGAAAIQSSTRSSSSSSSSLPSSLSSFELVDLPGRLNKRKLLKMPVSWTIFARYKKGVTVA